MGWWSSIKVAPEAIPAPAVASEAPVAVVADEAAKTAIVTSSSHRRKSNATSNVDDAAIAEGALVPRTSAEAFVVSGTSDAPVLDNGAASVYAAQISSFHNQLHVKADWIAAITAYGFGSAMHVHGQGNFLCTLSMWLAGNAFIMNSQYRGVFGPTPDAFKYESMASWIWMLSSFQQFRQVRVLKYAGYSSWVGLGCCAYFSGRHLTNVMMSPS